MAIVYVNPKAPIEVAIAKFKLKVNTEGIMGQLRKREFYVKPSIAKKNKSHEARKKLRKQMRGGE